MPMMSGFQVPLSSSPPSTPERRQNPTNIFAFNASNNPSTTPAGPPPSSAGSFTPAGLPPSSILGSSGLDSQYGKPISSFAFAKQPVLNPPRLQFHDPASSPSVAPYVRSTVGIKSGLSNEFKATGSSINQPFSIADDSDDGMDQEDRSTADSRMEEDEDYENRDPQYDLDQLDKRLDELDDRDSVDENMDGFEETLLRRKTYGNPRYDQSDLFMNPDVLKRGRDGEIVDFRRSSGNARQWTSADFMFGKMAKDICRQMGTPQVHEKDELILGTEGLLRRLYDEGLGSGKNLEALQSALAYIPQELLTLWSNYNDRNQVHISDEYATAIGPGPKASEFAHANFLASLLVSLHHPGHLELSSRQSTNASQMRGSIAPALHGQAKPLPLVLLEWMDNYHDPYPSQLRDIQAHKPSPANHRLFWDTILNNLLRGRVVAVVNALKKAGWQHSRNTMEDPKAQLDQIGYSGIALANIEKVIGVAISVLEQCPAMRGNWDIRDSDWVLFRLRAARTQEELRRFAEGRDKVDDVKSFETSNFGASTAQIGSDSYSGRAKKAESKIPWNIYQNLTTMYNLLLGESSSIIENSQDWCEATIGLLIWWNQGREDRRVALGRSHISPEAATSEAYFDKLTEAFYYATKEGSEFQVSTINPVEIGLAAIFEGDVEGVVGVLRCYSRLVAAAVAEIAALASWLPRPEPQNLMAMESLDQDDMEVLGIDASISSVDIKDQTLIIYAEGLADRSMLESPVTPGRLTGAREGWELAIEVLGRLDSTARAEEEIEQILDEFELTSSPTVDKLWRLLNDLSMTSLAEKTAEEYGNFLANDSYKYGEALWYYALSHKPRKVKDVLDLLISFSLIHSVAYPPQEEMDEHLQTLITSPKEALTSMSKLDFEAAQLLRKLLSGYATLRRFYDLRDAALSLPEHEMTKKELSERKEEAVVALIAVITSSDDNIRGGLYDEDRGAVVSVDFLLALLGEAMVFVNQPGEFLQPSQIDTLLKTIEDLQAVPPRVYAACDEFFQTVLASTPGLKGSTPMDLMKKSTSGLSGTSSYSLAGSSIMASQLQKSMGNSGVMVKSNAKRGWDWRKGIMASMKSEDMLQILRFGLAKELAKTWLLEADGQSVSRETYETIHAEAL